MKLINLLAAADSIYYMLVLMPPALSACLLLGALVCILSGYINGIYDGDYYSGQ